MLMRLLALATALAAPTAAFAHVTVTPTTASSGTYQVLRFGVGHGCDDRPTTALRLLMPAGVVTARPQPKPNWALGVEKAPGASGGVTAITWRGRLPSDQFDEFVVLVKLPAGTGPLAFPAEQSCGATVTHWNETVAPDAPRPSHPSPTVILAPATPTSGSGQEHRH